MRGLPLLCLALAACGAADGDNATTDQIERLSTPENLVEDVSNTARLEPLQPADGTRGPPQGGLCSFRRGAHYLLISSPSDVVARLNGELRHFVRSGQVDETGGFFEDRQVSISVGRTSPELVPGEAWSWPASITVTNRRTQVRSRVDGVWQCNAGDIE